MAEEFDHPFGDAEPEQAVKPTFYDPTAGYTFGARWVRSSLSGKRVRIDGIQREKAAMTTATLTPTHDSSQAPAARAMSVYDCIVAVSAEIAKEGISKNRSNQQQQYKFRGIDDVLNALSPLLARFRLVILPRIISRVVVERETRNGGVLFYVTVEAEFDFVSAADGSIHTVKTYGEAMDSADKATNKAMSAAYKYAAFQTFCIPTEGDNDADAVTHDVRPRVSAPAPSTKASPAAAPDGVSNRVAPSGGVSGRSDEGPDLGTAEPDDLPEGYRLIDDYKIDGDWHHVYWGRDAQGGTMIYKTKLAKIAIEAATAFKRREPVRLHSNKFPYLDRVEKLGITQPQIVASKYRDDDPSFCAKCGMPMARCEC